MKLSFLAVRTAIYASAFLWLWAWIAQRLRPFDERLGGALPEWCRTGGLVGLAAGGLVTVWCLWFFVSEGRGTPALFDPPRRLVALGPYRYSRNPMYVGGALLLAGFGLLQRSPSILVFIPAWWLLFHLLVVSHEEPILRGRFGRDYEDYCRETPRWIPRLLRFDRHSRGATSGHYRPAARH